VMLILGVPFRAPLAVMVGLFSLIPLVGATIAAVIVGVVTLFTDFPTATIIWTVIAALSPGMFSETAIASLTGATGTILAFVFGFVIRDTKRAVA
jgi:hypothetical protein